MNGRHTDTERGGRQRERDREEEWVIGRQTGKEREKGG